MNASISFQTLKNQIAPEVLVSETISLSTQSHTFQALLSQVLNKYNLVLRAVSGDTYELTFPGTSMISLPSLTNPIDAYRCLQVYLRVQRINGQQLRLEAYERMIGLKSERALYREVLMQRMECMKAYLARESELIVRK